VYSAMAICKAMILVGASLLVSTFSVRIKQVSEPMPHQPEQKHLVKNWGHLAAARKKSLNQDQWPYNDDEEEPAVASAEQNAHKGQTSKVEKDVADEAVVTLREDSIGLGLPRDPNGNPWKLDRGLIWNAKWP